MRLDCLTCGHWELHFFFL